MKLTVSGVVRTFVLRVIVNTPGIGVPKFCDACGVVATTEAVSGGSSKLNVPLVPVKSLLVTHVVVSPKE